jgi:uncharacterized protein (UPF0254 family)
MSLHSLAGSPPVASESGSILECFRRKARQKGGTTSESTVTLCPRLPLLEQMVDALGGIHGSVGSFVGLQHLLGSTASLVRRIAADRIEARRVLLLGKPYSANPDVVRFLLSECHYWVHPWSTAQELRKDNDGEMDRRIVATFSVLRCVLRGRAGKAGHRVLLLDDGGRAIRMLHTRNFADIRDRFTCVEQTRCGIRNIEDLDLQVPVVNVAESWVKLEHESPLIAESVNEELSAQLAIMKTAGVRTGTRALIIGYGAIGRAVAAECRRQGRRVSVFDADSKRQSRALADGYGVHRRLRSALHDAELVIGCTGKPVLDRGDYEHIAAGAILVSASSADAEFRGWQLRQEAACLGRPESWPRGTLVEPTGWRSLARSNTHSHPCFSLFRVHWGARHFYLVNGGFPVNFNGGVDPICPEKIQLTRSLLYVGAVQASWTIDPGLHELDDHHQHMLMAAYGAATGSLAA